MKFISLYLSFFIFVLLLLRLMIFCTIECRRLRTCYTYHELFSSCKLILSREHSTEKETSEKLPFSIARTLWDIFKVFYSCKCLNSLRVVVALLLFRFVKRLLVYYWFGQLFPTGGASRYKIKKMQINNNPQFFYFHYRIVYELNYNAKIPSDFPFGNNFSYIFSMNTQLWLSLMHVIIMYNEVVNIEYNWWTYNNNTWSITRKIRKNKNYCKI